MKKFFNLKTINFYPKGDKNLKSSVKIEQLSMGLKRLRKIFIENFTEIVKKDNKGTLKYKLLYKLDNLEINFYKQKTEVLKDKNGKIIINISYPINEDFLIKLLKNKINFFEANEVNYMFTETQEKEKNISI